MLAGEDGRPAAIAIFLTFTKQWNLKFKLLVMEFRVFSGATLHLVPPLCLFGDIINRTMWVGGGRQGEGGEVTCSQLTPVKWVHYGYWGVIISLTLTRLLRTFTILKKATGGVLISLPLTRLLRTFTILKKRLLGGNDIPCAHLSQNFYISSCSYSCLRGCGVILTCASQNVILP